VDIVEMTEILTTVDDEDDVDDFDDSADDGHEVERNNKKRTIIQCYTVIKWFLGVLLLC
jgi:hypothetical protein